MNAPLKLYYQCTYHPAMGNTIYIPLENLDTSQTLNLSNDLVVGTDKLVVDVSESRVGINNASPSKDLDVTGEIACSSHLTVGGNLTVNGTTTTVNTTSLRVEDTLIELGKNNTAGTSDLGLILKRPTGVGLKSNVAIVYSESVDTLKFGHTLSGSDATPVVFDTSNALAMSLNGSFVATGNVGIGTDSPGYALDVHGTSNVGALTATSVSGDGSGLTNLNASNISSGTLTRPVDTTTVTIDDYLIHDGDTNTKVGFPANDTFTVTTANSERLRVDSSGNVGIGTTSPGYKLHVSGDIYATGNVTAYSDVRKKKNLEIIERPIEKIEKLNGYTYEIDDKRYTGLVAQEVLKVLPEAVVGSEEKGYGLAYGNMAGLFVEAMKELKSENHSLKAQLASVLARLDALENP